MLLLVCCRCKLLTTILHPTASNEITAVPPQIAHLESLVQLELNDNALRSVPAELSCMCHAAAPGHPHPNDQQQAATNHALPTLSQTWPTFKCCACQTTT